MNPPTTHLPTTLSLARHTAVLAPRPAVRLLGVDPYRGVVVEDLPPPLAAVLDALHAPCATADLVVTAADRGVPPLVTVALLADLLSAGALVDADVVARAVRAHEASTVVVHGCGPLAAGLVPGLRQAGAGTVHLATAGTVEAGDLGTGLAIADIGRLRLTAVGAAADRVTAGASTRAPPQRQLPDLVVLADEPPGQCLVEGLHRDGVAHLVVALREGHGLVGPLVLPGRTPCLGCLERHRTDDNPYWPAVAAGLAGRPGQADGAGTLATVGWAVGQALAALSGLAGGTAPATLGATLELDVAAGTVVRRDHVTHPACPCRCTTSANTGHGGTIMG